MPSLEGVNQTVGSPSAYPCFTIHSRMTNFCGFPVTDIGSSSTMRTRFGTLEVRNLSVAERDNVFGRRPSALVGHLPGADLLPVPFVWIAEHLRLPDTGMTKIATSAVALHGMHVSGGDDANPDAFWHTIRHAADRLVRV